MATDNIMMAAVKAGGDRQAIHERIRKLSIEAGRQVKEEGKDNNLLELIAADSSFNLSLEQLKSEVQALKYTGRSSKQVEEFIQEYIEPILKKYKDELGIEAKINV